MPKTIRVRLSPTPAPQTLANEPDRANVVTGVEVTLETRGQGSTTAKLAPQPATLVFQLALFRRVRSEQPQFKPLARLSGQLELRSSGAPVFTADEADTGGAVGFVYDDPELNAEPTPEPEASADSDADLDEQASDPPPKRPRMLQLELASSSFANVLDAAGHNQRLLLPDDVNRAHYLELTAELLIAGSAEAALGSNDVLDVHISDAAPLDAPHYELRLVDEVGENLQGIALTLVEDDRDFDQRSDSKGRIFKLPISGAGARVSFSDVQQLKDLLKELWSKPRGKPRFEGGPDVVTITPRDFDSAIEVTTDAPVLVCIRPHVLMARLRGMFFDTNKSFLLPSALEQLPQLDELYQANKGSQLLIVGHTDTTADANTNDPLSLERADSMLAYLKDDVEAWLGHYSTSISEKRRWGRTEDLLMLRARAGFVAKATEDQEIRDFQSEQALEVDGVIGKETRRRLIELYMDRDGTTLPDDIQPTTHGCGENFPVDASQEELDPVAADDTADLGDRRVELFFFDAEFGIQPKPPAKSSKPGSTEYPEWRRRADAIRTLQLNTRTVRLFLLDSRYQLLKNTAFELTAGGVARSGFSDENGLLEEREVPITEKCEIRWGRSESNFDALAALDPIAPLKAAKTGFDYFNLLNLKLEEQVDNDLRLRAEARARLDNMGHRSGRFTDDYRAHRQRYALTDAAFDRAGFDQLARIHRDGTEAPVSDPDPIGPDTDPEQFELDGDDPLELVLSDAQGQPIANQQVNIATEAGVIRSGRTDEQGRVALRGLEFRTFDVQLPGIDADAAKLIKKETANG